MLADCSEFPVVVLPLISRGNGLDGIPVLDNFAPVQTKQIKKRVGAAFEDIGYSPSYAMHLHHVIHPITGSY